MLSMNERASSKYATFGLLLAIIFLFLRCKDNNLFRDYETFRYFFAFSFIKVLTNVPGWQRGMAEGQVPGIKNGGTGEMM